VIKVTKDLKVFRDILDLKASKGHAAHEVNKDLLAPPVCKASKDLLAAKDLKEIEDRLVLKDPSALLDIAVLVVIKVPRETRANASATTRMSLISFDPTFVLLREMVS